MACPSMGVRGLLKRFSRWCNPFGVRGQYRVWGNIDSEEGQLWSRSLKGESEASAYCLTGTATGVFHHPYRPTGDQQETEDIMAAALLELWRRREKVGALTVSCFPGCS